MGFANSFTGGGGGGVFAEIASQAEAQAGTDNVKGMTPLRTAEAIAALGATLPASVSQAEAEAGTEVANRLWSPERVKQAIAALGGGGGGEWTEVASVALDGVVTELAYTAPDLNLVDHFRFLIIGSGGNANVSPTIAWDDYGNWSHTNANTAVQTLSANNGTAPIYAQITGQSHFKTFGNRVPTAARGITVDGWLQIAHGDMHGVCHSVAKENLSPFAFLSNRLAWQTARDGVAVPTTFKIQGLAPLTVGVAKIFTRKLT